MEDYTNFYPTPRKLVKEILPRELWKYGCILEPSAGKGDIVDEIKSEGGDLVVDCIEINPELQATLRGKKYNVVANDFLTFTPQYHYDLIIMNPPFDKGATHLLKALDVEKKGGRVICILNAETLKNPYSNERKVLAQKLETLDASIVYKTSSFTSAERTTDVEIAVIDVEIPEDVGTSFIYTSLKEKMYTDINEQATDVVNADYLCAAVANYNLEIESGLKLIREYKALSPYIMSSIQVREYDAPILQLKIGDGELSEVQYVQRVRMKYWRALFMDERFTGAMTSEQRSDYEEKVCDLVNFDFCMSNIKELQMQMCKNLVSGIEDTIMKLFDDLSYQYSWSPEFGNNIHYYNGWSTNKAWFVNSKVILPMKVYNDIWKKMKISGYDIVKILYDMEKAFNYLAGCPGADVYIKSILQSAEDADITKNVKCKYFTLTFYKKGTCHITFNDMDLLKKLNIFGGKGKNMLPPRYGKVKYDDFSEKEKEVVNEFDGGKAEYMKIYNGSDKYIIETAELLPQIA